MDNNEVLFFWNYFCSLCRMLENTTQYVDHTNEDNKNVNSYEFQKIITLASIEFESIAKQLCLIANPNLKVDSSRFNIIQITKNINKYYPELKKTTIRRCFNILNPLQSWEVLKKEDGNEYCSGIEWWSSYTGIKHNAYINYKQSTLENAINAMASLMVLEIHFVKVKTGSNKIMNDNPCPYFINPFQSEAILIESNL